MLWRLPIKSRFVNTEGLRERVIKSRPGNPRPPRSFYRRYRVDEGMREGRKIFTHSPRKGRPRLHILYLHGGAHVYEMMGLQWSMIRRLLDRSDAAVTVPLYPLAPEHTCEQILQFVMGVYDALVKEAGETPIVILGDSSGGGLSLALAQAVARCREAATYETCTSFSLA